MDINEIDKYLDIEYTPTNSINIFGPDIEKNSIDINGVLYPYHLKHTSFYNLVNNYWNTYVHKKLIHKYDSSWKDYEYTYDNGTLNINNSTGEFIYNLKCQVNYFWTELTHDCKYSKKIRAKQRVYKLNIDTPNILSADLIAVKLPNGEKITLDNPINVIYNEQPYYYEEDFSISQTIAINNNYNPLEFENPNTYTNKQLNKYLPKEVKDNIPLYLLVANRDLFKTYHSIAMYLENNRNIYQLPTCTNKLYLFENKINPLNTDKKVTKKTITKTTTSHYKVSDKVNEYLHSNHKVKYNDNYTFFIGDTKIEEEDGDEPKYATLKIGNRTIYIKEEDDDSTILHRCPLLINDDIPSVDNSTFTSTSSSSSSSGSSNNNNKFDLKNMLFNKYKRYSPSNGNVDTNYLKGGDIVVIEDTLYKVLENILKSHNAFIKYDFKSRDYVYNFIPLRDNCDLWNIHLKASTPPYMNKQLNKVHVDINNLKNSKNEDLRKAINNNWQDQELNNKLIDIDGIIDDLTNFNSNLMPFPARIFASGTVTIVTLKFQGTNSGWFYYSLPMYADWYITTKGAPILYLDLLNKNNSKISGVSNKGVSNNTRVGNAYFKEPKWKSAEGMHIGKDGKWHTTWNTKDAIHDPGVYNKLKCMNEHTIFIVSPDISEYDLNNTIHYVPYAIFLSCFTDAENITNSYDIHNIRDNTFKLNIGPLLINNLNISPEDKNLLYNCKPSINSINRLSKYINT